MKLSKLFSQFPRSVWLFYPAVFLTVFGAKLSLIHRFGRSQPFWDAWEVEASWLCTPLPTPFGGRMASIFRRFRR